MGRGNLTVWRVLSWKYLSGGLSGYFNQRSYLYDDLITSDRLSAYLKLMEERGIEYIKMEKQGTLKFVMDNNLHPKPRPGAKRLSAENLNHKMEEFDGA